MELMYHPEENARWDTCSLTGEELLCRGTLPKERGALLEEGGGGGWSAFRTLFSCSNYYKKCRSSA